MVLTPPRSLVQRGLVRPSTLWRVDKAMYGLDTSPRDWGLHRNSVLRDLKIVVVAKMYDFGNPLPMKTYG